MTMRIYNLNTHNKYKKILTQKHFHSSYFNISLVDNDINLTRPLSSCRSYVHDELREYHFNTNNIKTKINLKNNQKAKFLFTEQPEHLKNLIQNLPIFNEKLKKLKLQQCTFYLSKDKKYYLITADPIWNSSILHNSLFTFIIKSLGQIDPTNIKDITGLNSIRPNFILYDTSCIYVNTLLNKIKDLKLEYPFGKKEDSLVIYHVNYGFVSQFNKTYNSLWPETKQTDLFSFYDIIMADSLEELKQKKENQN